MKAALTATPEEKKKGQLRAEARPDVSVSAHEATGAPAGVPLFLQRSAADSSPSAPQAAGPEEEEEELEEEKPVQTKLVAEELDDPAEQEADDAASQIVFEPERRRDDARSNNVRSNDAHSIDHGDALKQPSVVSAPVHAPSHTPPMTQELRLGLGRASGSGQPLPPSVRDFFEPRFGHDFAGVRVHTGADAAHLSHELKARAFTQGGDIYFASGQYAPHTQAGKELLAHELTHVIQQSEAPPVRKTKTSQEASDAQEAKPSPERKAAPETAGRATTRRETVTPPGREPVTPVAAGLEIDDSTAIEDTARGRSALDVEPPPTETRASTHTELSPANTELASTHAELSSTRTESVPAHTESGRRSETLTSRPASRHAVQFSHAVSQPDDPLEREADAVAGQVLGGSGVAGVAISSAPRGPGVIARQADDKAADRAESIADEVEEILDKDPWDSNETASRKLVKLDNATREPVIEKLKDRINWIVWSRFATLLSETPPPVMQKPRGTPDARAAEAQTVKQAESEVKQAAQEGWIDAEKPPAKEEVVSEAKGKQEKEKGKEGAKGAKGKAGGARAGKDKAEAGAPAKLPPAPKLPTARPDVEPLVPAPPEGLTPTAEKRFQRVQGNAKSAAVKQTEEIPTAEENVKGARKAVTEPEAEADAKVEDKLVETLGARVEPSPEIEELCQRIYEVIRAKRPPDEDALVKADPKAMAKEAGGELNETVEGDVKRVDQNYDAMDDKPKADAPPKAPPLEPPPGPAGKQDLNAAAAVPDPVPEKDVSLDADVKDNEKKMEDAGMNSEPAQLVQEGPIAEAREAQGELKQKAERDPAEVLAEQQAARAAAGADMQALQQSALKALTTARATTVTDVQTKKEGMVGSEEQTRETISKKAQGIFNEAQTQVNTLLTPLSKTAMEKWEKGVAVLAEEFKQTLARVKSWIDERHSGGWGSVVSLWDSVAGLPDWVTEEYDKAEKTFGDGVCKLIREISVDVNSVIATCEALIDGAHKEIAKLFSDLPEGLKEWALQEQASFDKQLAGLQDKVTKTQKDFNKDLADRAAQSVQDVRQQIHELREAAKGLIGRIADAINEFLDDPVKFIINGLLKLLGISPSAFWAVVARIQEVISDIADDPLGFASNLMDAVGQGFQNFFDNIGTHLMKGMLDWLLGGLSDVGVQIPTDLSLKSVITFFLQLMGITWTRVRKLLVKHIGEQNVALIEKAYQIISVLIEKGPEGLFEMIQDQLNPQTILDMVLETAKDFLIEALIKQVTARIIMLFNPVGAILQALEAIYRVLKWIFQNAAKIFTLIETIVNGIADILAGNIGGMAKAVEKALAGLISPVIAFLADYLGLGDLPKKIQTTVEKMQTWVEGILDRVIGWLAEKGRALLKAIGLGGDDKKPAGDSEGELGKTVKFSAEGESHRVWVQTQGKQATLMVASDAPKAIVDKLAEWSSEEKLKTVADKRKAVEGDIAKARQILGIADKEADGLAQKVGSATEKPGAEGKADVEKQDDKLEAQEEDLATILQRLFQAFGETPDPKVLFGVELQKMDSNAVSVLEKHLQPDSKGIKGKMADWPTFKTQYLEQTAAYKGMFDVPHSKTHKFGQALLDKLTGSVQDWMDKNKAKTVDIDKKAREYVEDKKGTTISAASMLLLQAQIFEATKKDEAMTSLTADFTKKLEEDYPIDPAKAFKVDLDKMHKSARATIELYLKPGAEKAKDQMKDWATFKAYLEKTPSGSDMVANPLSKSHDFGGYTTPNQAIPALTAANTKGVIDASAANAYENWLNHRKEAIHDGTHPFSSSAAELRKQIYDGANEPTANKTLQAEFVAKLEQARFAELNHPDVVKALEDAKGRAGPKWVAVFATGGIKLMSAPVGGAEPKPMLLKDVWGDTDTVIGVVAKAVTDTILKDSAYQANHLGTQTAEEAGRTIAEGIVQNMGSVPLYYVKNTDIPRHVEGGAHVIVREGVAKTEALYTAINKEAEATAGKALKGQIHHVIPLYLGGGHPITNLMRAEGQKNPAEDEVDESAHKAMHDLIDNMKVDVWVNNNIQTVRLEETKLRSEIPKDALKIIIGTLYDDGSIAYEETKLVYNDIIDKKTIP